MALDFTIKPVLESALVTLRPVGRADAANLAALMTDPEVARLTGSVHGDAGDGGRTWELAELEKIYDEWSVAPDRLVWVVVDNNTELIVGEAVLSNLDTANRSCGYRIWISGARDRGLGTETTRLIMRYAFEDQGLNRVDLEVYDFNPRARHVYEKVGFVVEGTLRQALRFNREWVDAHIMSILASEWAVHRGHPNP